MNNKPPVIDLVTINNPEWTRIRQELQDRLISAGSELLKHTGAQEVHIHFPTGCVTVHRHPSTDLDG